jgi:hypothetical protein
VGGQIKADETGEASSKQTQTRNAYRAKVWKVEQHFGDVLQHIYYIYVYRVYWTTLSVPQTTVELGYNVMKGTEYFVSSERSVFITEEYNVTVNSEELIGTTEYLTL